MGLANERWHYIVTLPLIGGAHTQNDPYTRPHGLFWVCAQPMRDDVTMQHHLSLAEPIPRMIPKVSHTLGSCTYICKSLIAQVGAHIQLENIGSHNKTGIARDPEFGAMAHVSIMASKIKGNLTVCSMVYAVYNQENIKALHEIMADKIPRNFAALWVNSMGPSDAFIAPCILVSIVS